MSAAGQPALLAPSRRARPAGGRDRLRAERLSLTAFTLLGLLGVLRWQTMLAAPPTWRMLGLLALAVIVIGLGRLSLGRSRPVHALLAAAVVLCALGMIPMSGFPLAWSLHLRVAVTARAISHGLSSLPAVIVPLQGHDRATRAVIALGAGLLLLGGALTLAASRVPRGEGRLVAAALPLVVLATVPSALARPHAAYLHGLLLFVPLALLVFSERVRPAAAGSAAAVLAAAALGGLLLSPVLDGHRAWISFTKVKLTGSGPGPGETFDWSQTYGPLDWPHTGATVLEVRARFPAYWKAEDLDTFDGAGWTGTPVPEGDPMTSVSPTTAARFTQTLTFQVHAMHTSQVIAAGVAGPPLLPGNLPVEGGSEPGTYVSPTPLGPGTSYRVRVYAPRPTPAELERAPVLAPPAMLTGELRIQLPPVAGATAPVPFIQFASYTRGAAPLAVDGRPAAQAAAALAASAYGPVYALAQRLRIGTSSPYDYVRAVSRYLARGFRYTEDPRAASLPILAFLLRTRAGYCQQFAGSMALLLRMGGVPARVAVGFATGAYDSVHHDYIVADFDAHAWVEAWLGRYGWVTFDPTPSADPALAGQTTIEPSLPATSSHQRLPQIHRPTTSRHAGGLVRAQRARSRPAGFPWPLFVGAVRALLLLVIGGWLWRLRRWPVTPSALLAELERAYVRCGRPLPPGTTLAALEARLADSPEAASYVRSLRLARYGQSAEGPPRGRRAVRRRLREGLGPTGRLRALMALPPRPGRGLH